MSIGGMPISVVKFSVDRTGLIETANDRILTPVTSSCRRALPSFGGSDI